MAQFSDDWSRYSGRRDVIAAHLPWGKAEMSGKLSPRERECLYWAGRRLSDAEIAQRLDLSARTVSHHLARAYAKLGVRDRIRAAAKLSNLYPQYPLPIGYEDKEGSPPPTSAQQTDTSARGLASAFAKLPRPPSRLVRLLLIPVVAALVAFVFAGVTVIMSVSADRAATYAPDSALTQDAILRGD